MIFKIKTSIICLLSLLILSSSICEEPSGLKFALNTNYASLLQNLDVTKFVRNTSLIDETIEIKGPLYKIQVFNATLTDVKMPETVVVHNYPAKADENANGKTSLTMKTMNIKLNVTFDITVALIKDQNKDSPIEVIIDEIYGEYNFVNGQIKFSSLKIVLKDIIVKFHSEFYDIIYKVFKAFIIDQINKSTPKIQEKIQTGINKLINEPSQVKVPQVNLFVNTTNTNKPDLLFTKKQAEMKFLQVLNTEYEDSVTAFLTFGIKGLFFSDASEILDIPSPPTPQNFKFLESDIKKGVNILVSDYSLSSMFHILQLSGMLNKHLDRSNFVDGYPMTTDGLTSLIEELSSRYANNPRKCFITISVPTKGLRTPQIVTTKNSHQVEVEFNFELQVQESDDIWLDPVVVLSTKNKVTIDYKPEITNEVISFVPKGYDIKNIDINTNLFESFDKDSFIKNFNKFLGAFIDQNKSVVKQIDLNGTVQGLIGLPFEISELSWTNQDGYSSIAFNVSRKLE